MAAGIFIYRLKKNVYWLPGTGEIYVNKTKVPILMWPLLQWGKKVIDK